MLTRSRLAAVLVAAAVPLSLLATSAPSYGAVAEPPHVDVVADELPEGPPPTVAYTSRADWSDNTLVRPDGSVVELGGTASQPVRVRGGYLVSVRRGTESGDTITRFVRVPDRGAPRTVRRLGHAQATDWDLSRSTVSSDGRLIAMYDGAFQPSKARAMVMRTSDGHTVAVRRAIRSDLLAFQGRRVLVLRDPATAGGRRSLAWWNIDTNRMRPVLTTPRSRIDQRWLADGEYPYAAAAAADLSAGQVAFPSGRREVVRPVPGHRGRTWRTDRGELVQSWSPDDRFVVTAVDPDYVSGGHLTATLRIRRAATGAIVSEFRGLLAVDTEFHGAPAWESADTFLTRAWSRYGTEPGDGALMGERQIRCTISSLSCEAILPEE